MSGDENKLKKYRFPETLTNQSRWFGLPLDELRGIFHNVPDSCFRQWIK